MRSGPVIVLGAARSGTKLMRSLAAKASAAAEVPYDVNYLWRLGSEDVPHDALAPTGLTDEAIGRIRQELRRAAGVGPESNDFVEKTVSNILRVPFVQRIFPDAKFLVVVRDGRDVAESAARCWTEKPSLGYAFSKARSFPWRKCFGYARKAAVDAASRALGKGQVPVWGPRYPGIDVDVRHFDVLEVCARQWAACMDAYKHARHRVLPGRFLEIHYEDLIEAPEEEIERLAEFLETRRLDDLIAHARVAIRRDHVGKRRQLSDADQIRLEGLLSGTLRDWGYPLEFDAPKRGTNDSLGSSGRNAA